MLTVFICGFGARAQHHVDALIALPGFSICGVYDPSPLARESAGRQAIHTWSDLRAGLVETQPDIVLLATPPAWRLALVDQVLELTAPRLIVVEKPLALSTDEGFTMNQHCEAHGVALKVSHQLPFTTEFGTLLNQVHDGCIGKIRSIEAACFGTVFDQGSHLIDLVGRLLPLDNPHWLEANGSRNLSDLASLRPLPAGFMQDHKHPGRLWTSAHVRLSSGVDVYLGCGVLDACPLPELGPWLQKRLRVIGSEGYAEAHSASHCRVICSGKIESYIRSSLDEYGRSLIRYYENIEALLTREDSEEPTKEIEHDLQTVQVMEAIQTAVEENRPVRCDGLGSDILTIRGTPAEPVTEQESSGISIIIPMEDHRGMGVDAVRSWIGGQRCDSDRYELIILLDDTSFDLEAPLNALLRPQDRLIKRSAMNEMELYHYGAAIARREYLFFTEPHCIAEKEAVSEAEAFFHRGEADGFCVRSSTIAQNSIARMESRMYDEGFVVWSAPEHWGKVILRGFAVPRRVYFAAGGYKFEFDRFAEWLLAAELKSRGVTLHYAPGVGVAHLYSDNFSLLDQFIKEFTDGECLYRLSYGASSFCREFFGEPPEWVEATGYSESYYRALSRASWAGVVHAGLRRTLDNRLACFVGGVVNLPKMLFGRGWLVWQYRNAAWRAKLAAGNPFLRDQARQQHFNQYWSRTTEYCRVVFGLKHVSDESVGWDGATVQADNTLGPAFQGFYPLERAGQHQFWWSQPMFGVRLNPGVGGKSIAIKMCEFRGEFPMPLAFLVNDHKTQRLETEIDRLNHELRVTLPAPVDTTVWLIISVVCWREANRLGQEKRSLGLPVKSIFTR